MKPALTARLHPVILCIEDKASPLALRKIVLEKSGYKVLAASSGEEALKLLQSTHVDLVLSDHYLRGELGTALAAKIKALQSNLPVLLVSGAADAGQGNENVDGVVPRTTVLPVCWFPLREHYCFEPESCFVEVPAPMRTKDSKSHSSRQKKLRPEQRRQKSTGVQTRSSAEEKRGNPQPSLSGKQRRQFFEVFQAGPLLKDLFFCWLGSASVMKPNQLRAQVPQQEE